MEDGKYDHSLHKSPKICGYDSKAVCKIKQVKPWYIAKEIKNAKNLLVELESLESYDDGSVFELTEKLEKCAKSGDLFFFKGSRGIKLERIADKLAAKVVKNEI